MSLCVCLGFQAVRIYLIRIASALTENMLTKLKCSFHFTNMRVTHTQIQINDCFSERKEEPNQPH